MTPINGDTILAFIHAFTNNGKRKAVMETFTGGCCYWFAVILQHRFGGMIMYDAVKGHFACRIGDSVYDIRGDVTEKGIYEEWDMYDASGARAAVYNACVLLKTVPDDDE